MAPKSALIALALCAMALAGCTSGSDGNDGDSTTSGSGGIGGGVSGPGGVGGNATVSGSASSTNSSTNGSAPDKAEVILAANEFTPEDVTIQMGGTVTWRHNDADARHTVTSDEAAWDSHPSCASPVTPLSDCMDNGDTFDQTFPTIGTFSYHCKIHPEMTGVVNVVA